MLGNLFGQHFVRGTMLSQHDKASFLMFLTYQRLINIKDLIIYPADTAWIGPQPMPADIVGVCSPTLSKHSDDLGPTNIC